jgi:hypothetical protein
VGNKPEHDWSTPPGFARDQGEISVVQQLSIYPVGMMIQMEARNMDRLRYIVGMTLLTQTADEEGQQLQLTLALLKQIRYLETASGRYRCKYKIIKTHFLLIPNTERPQSIYFAQ